MDNRANLHEPLFSRNSNSTPPTSPPQHHAFPQQAHIANNSTPSLIDALFQNMSAPANPEHNSPQSSLHEPHPADSYHESSGVASVMSLTEETTLSSSTIADRQNSLLSLIGAPMAGRPQPASQPVQNVQQQQSAQLQQQQQQQQSQQSIPQSQQVPTPPSSSQRSNVSPQQSDTQKMLENIIAGGTSSRSTNYSDTPRNNQQQPAPSPPYSQRDDYRNFNQYEQGSDSSPRRAIAQPNLPPPQPQQQPVQPPSPRRSMFEFTSAFDHLSNTSTAAKKKPSPSEEPVFSSASTFDHLSLASGSVKKKPVPTPPSTMPSVGEDPAWSPMDPKRQSVDNLLETLTRGQPLVSQLPQPPAYDSYLSGDFGDMDQASSRAPLPPIPGTKPTSIPNRTSSPRDSSPKTQTLHRPQPRPVDSGIGQSPFSSGIPFPPGTRIEKEGSPGLRGNKQLKPQQPAPVQPQPQVQAQAQPKYTNPKPANVNSNYSGQNIVFDVSQPLEEIQARDCVKWTPIALVKQDAVFLPGTTIGATHWVAYAMTRGRVRVISRSSGDRTLLQLPQVFSMSASVIDMAVFNNRLAGVTSDGGFVVWELPDIITDDVPGRVLLCVPPTNDPRDAIRGVKWHSKEVDTVAIASDDKVFVIDLANTHPLHGQPLPHSELHHLGQRFEVHSPIVAFDFDVAHNAIATITEDANLAIWNMQDTLPYSVQKIVGEDIPSSLTFVDGGIVVGRKNGTIFQLLSNSTKAVLSTITFVNGSQEDVDMFGHAVYDTRIQTLWVANSRRESLIALKLHVDPNYLHDDGGRGHIEQVVEFAGIKPTIHFVILTADADPHGDEAHAACVAAKIQPGELALVGFSVHSTGVDQVLVRREKFDNALVQLQHTGSKFPAYDASMITISNVLGLENKARQPLPAVPQNAPVPQSSAGLYSSIRGHSPTPEEAENEFSEGRASDHVRSKGGKNKGSNWKDSDDPGKEKNTKPGDAAIISESTLGQALSREIRKTEENLHVRIGKLIGKEMDKQHARFEEARAHDQAEDFSRQEKILKLISNELTRNTTRVVEMAVKNEIQNSVLPSLENITRNEVKAALNDQIGVSMVDVISRSLPAEMEKLVLRPSVANHFTNILSSALAPVLEHHIKEILSTTFFQMHANQTAVMQQDLMRELRMETSNIKGEFTQWHNEALRAQEGTIREMRDTIRSLSEQVKFLSSLPNVPPAPQHISQPPPQQSMGPSLPPQQQGNNNMTIRQPLPTNNAPLPSYLHNQSHSFQQQVPPPPQQQQQPPHHIQQQQQWYTALAAPQASVPATLPQAPPSQPQDRTPPPKTEQWDENYLSILHSQDPAKLRDVLQRTNPDLVFPINGTPLVSQAVILTLIHRLSAVLGESVATDETFKTSLWWLQRVSTLLRPDDKLIADFIPRVIPTVQQSLNTTKQRLAILPGGAGMIDTVRALSDVQEVLRRKVGQQ